MPDSGASRPRTAPHLLGRVEAPADYVAPLLHEVRVGEELEAARQMRLQAEGPAVQSSTVSARKGSPELPALRRHQR